MLRAVLVLAIVAAAGAPDVVLGVCLSPKCGEEFTSAVERLRRQIQRSCECPRRADSPSRYRNCVKNAVRTEAQVQREDLPRACLSAVRRCEIQSICGDTSKAVVCCLRKPNGILAPSIKATAAACKGLACQFPRHVADLCGADVPKRVGPFVDRGQTVRDRATGLEWEKKESGAAPGGLHAPTNVYAWAGSCAGPNADRFENVRCQPNAAATAACHAQTPESTWTAGCEPCAASDGPCIVPGDTTIWDWLAQVNAANFAGHGDWRIPTVALNGEAGELESIYDPLAIAADFCTDRLGSPPIVTDGDSPVFGSTGPADYWAATGLEPPYRAAYTLDRTRQPMLMDKVQTARVRAVRRD